MSHQKKVVSARTPYRSTDFLTDDEESFVRYTSEGKMEAVAISDFELQKMWDDELTKWILIELFNHTLPIVELNQKISQRMNTYYQTKFANVPDEQREDVMEMEYYAKYNPYNSTNSLKGGLLRLIGKGLIETPTRDGTEENTYYCLTRDLGLSFVIQQFLDMYIGDPLLWEILHRQKEPVHITFLAMKWMEINQPNVDQLIFLFAEGLPSKEFVGVYKKYLIQIEGEDPKKMETAEMTDRINDEIVQKVNSLVMGKYIVQDKRTKQFVLSQPDPKSHPSGASGIEIIQSVQPAVMNFLSEMMNYYLLNDSPDHLYVELSAVGKIVSSRLMDQINRDPKLLSSPPIALNDADYHDAEMIIPPIDIMERRHKENENSNKQFSIYMKLGREYYWTERVKKQLRSPFNMACLSVLGLTAIIGGLWNMFSGYPYGDVMIGVGITLLVGFFILINLRIKWERPEYLSTKILKERERILTPKRK